jgi:hypothetical protein
LAEWPDGYQPFARFHLRKVSKDAPIAVLVGVGQVGTRHGGAKAHVIQLGANRSQTGFNIAQALPGDQLSEGHGEELLPAEKLLGVPVAIVVSHAAAELAIRKKTYQLGEDAFAVDHTTMFRDQGKAGAYFKSRQAKNANNVLYLYRLRDQSTAFTRQPCWQTFAAGMRLDEG